MAWNGSEDKGAANAPKERTAKAPPSKWRGLVALVVVVAAGGLAAWLMMGGEKGERGEKVGAKPSQIAEVKPAVVTNAVVEEVEVAPEPEKPDPNARPTRPGQKLNGYVMLGNGKLHKIKGDSHSHVDNKGKYAIFDYPSENVIAGILSVEPGQNIVGMPNYKGRFTENFLKSTMTPIIVKEDDPDDVKALKRAVNEAKIELKLAHDRGEDIEEIIKKAREDAQRLARAKQNVRREVMTGINNAETAQDAELMLSAANKLLEAQGIAPLDDTPLMRIKMKFNNDQDNKKETDHE